LRCHISLLFQFSCVFIFRFAQFGNCLGVLNT
jgi:hypothetical protein